MMTSNPEEVQTFLQNAITALKRGDKTTARSLAEQAAALAPRSEEPWLVLAAVATSPGQSLAYIKRALQLNPESVPAQQALDLTLKKQRENLHALPPSKPPVPIRRTHLPASSQKTASPTANRAVPVEASFQPESYPGGIPPAANPDILSDTAPHKSQSHSPNRRRKKFSFSPYLILGLSLLGVFVFSGFLVLFFGEKLLGELSQAVQPPQPAPTSPLAESTLPQAMEGMSLSPTQAALVPNPEILGTPGEVFPTPSGDVQAEISLLETSASPDGSIQISLSILNYGPNSFTLRAEDVALIPPDGTPLELDKSTPRLPEKLNPGETQSFTFIFPRPTTPTATLQIFTVEYDIEGY